MLTFLHNGNFPLYLVFLLVRVIVPKSFLRNAINDLDSYRFPRIDILGLFHLAVNTRADISQDLVIINCAIAGGEITMAGYGMCFKDLVDRV
jgi:hypothetical protein